MKKSKISANINEHYGIYIFKCQEKMGREYEISI